MPATKKPRKTAAQYRAECRARAEATTGFGVLPQPTAEQLAARDPRNDPAVQAILREWYGQG